MMMSYSKNPTPKTATPKTPIPKTPRQVAHTPKKRFGQNFLHDTTIITQIVDAIGINKGDNLLEIGPGLGALTEPMLAQVNTMIAIELDSELARRLKLHIGANSHNRLTVVHANALQVDFAQWVNTPNYDGNSGNLPNSTHQSPPQTRQGKLRIVGNLPYNISTPLLFYLLEFADCIDDMHFMLQKEVVQRIVADVGTKAYGRLSVMMQYYCACQYLLTVPPSAFYPPPKVVSAVFRLRPYTQKPIVANDESWFALVVRECFNHRRKTLRAIFKNNALLPVLGDDVFGQVGIDPNARPETLSVGQFVALSNISLKIPAK